MQMQMQPISYLFEMAVVTFYENNINSLSVFAF